ncbi:GNAT family N-acetyltransferase [Chamaesiphon sp.]|uniref:GNAT family N-acetyltransferase n=1 Tax=Chamaesiphon sp. TaxID=2814140 RepID=UPI0035945236
MFKQYRNYTIRSWQPADRLAAAQVIENALAEYGLGWEPDGADRDVLAVEEYYLDRGGEFWVIEAQGEIIGTSAYYPCAIGSSTPTRRSEKAVEIRKMYLTSKTRGKGLGNYLLGALEQAIAQRGYCEIRIETASILTAAVKLYESHGYQPISDVETARCDRAYIKTLELFAAREPLL